jgi:hypothetical protein
MFVDDVQIVQCEAGVIPSGLAIWPYYVNDHVNDGRPCSLYLSTVKRTYEFVPFSA